MGVYIFELWLSQFCLEAVAVGGGAGPRQLAAVQQRPCVARKRTAAGAVERRESLPSLVREAFPVAQNPRATKTLLSRNLLLGRIHWQFYL